MRALVVLVLLGGLALALSATALPAPQTRLVSVHDHSFDPDLLVLQMGDTVVWSNADLDPHSVIPQLFTGWNSDDLQQGQSYAHTFDLPSVTPYYCGVHPAMRGFLVVLPLAPN